MSFGYNLTPMSSFGFGFGYPGLSGFGYAGLAAAPYLHSTPYACFPTTTAEFLNALPPAVSPTTEFKSQIEQSILNSSDPLPLPADAASVCLNGSQGIILNKSEIENWKGDLPLYEYKINEDFCPQIIFKKPSTCLNLTKKHTIKYLKPPPAPKPGDIVIRQEANIPTGPAPPVILRQVPPKPCTPEPLVIREKPPCPPIPLCKKEIVIPGKRLAPAPRRVVVEKLPLLPAKPQSVVVERWLPYEKPDRRVIFQKAPPDPCPEKPKNLIIQWHPPCVCVKEQFKNLGVQPADPADYVARYGPSLKNRCELPKFALEMKPADGTDPNTCPAHEPKLVGDLSALNLIDLEQEGLGMYKKYLNCGPSPTASNKTVSPTSCLSASDAAPAASGSTAAESSAAASSVAPSASATSAAA